VQHSFRRLPGRPSVAGALIGCALALSLGCSTSPPASGSSGAAGHVGAAGGGAGRAAGAGGAGSAGTAGSGGAGSGGAGAGAGAGGAPNDGGATGGNAGAGGAVVDAGSETAAAGGPGSDGDGNVTIGPTYQVAPELTVNAAVAHGTVTGFNIASSESPIFPGVSGAYSRQGWIYVPAGYVKGTAMPFIIAQDGRDYMSRLPRILDNMIAAKRVPSMIALMIMAGPGDGPGSERGLEYDTVSDAFTNWVETTVLPKMVKSYGVAFTTNPEGRASMGGSSGGAAAFTMGWFHPELYRRILTFSGTYTAQGPTAAYPDGAWAYPDHLIAQTPMKPLRVWMEVGEMDAGATATLASKHNFILANQMVAAALMGQGYHCQFDFAKGAMHNDPKVWDAMLPSALEWLWRGYDAN
jgi:iron(III)-enterobactin esterase